jgi:hypothetical protein
LPIHGSLEGVTFLYPENLTPTQSNLKSLLSNLSIAVTFALLNSYQQMGEIWKQLDYPIKVKSLTEMDHSHILGIYFTFPEK